MLLAQAYSYAQTFKVIVNSSVGVNVISKKEIADLFLKKKTKWNNGMSVLPVDQVSNSSVRESFSQQVLGKSVAAIRSFWQQSVFSGIASAPPEKNNDTEVLEFVRKNPGAIGYISASANAEGVKTLSFN
jgi:ABC-type phosphate transport system substrate-binding protein